jgi:hypothetical protein
MVPGKTLSSAALGVTFDLTVVASCLLPSEEQRAMNDEFLKLYEAAKALVTYIDREDVFDKVGDMGCGGVDHHQSEAFYNLIADARKAVREFENQMQESP